MDRMYRERRLSKCFCGDDKPWETPNTKLQTPEKTQAPNPNDTGQSLWKLAVGASLGFGAWCLVFGVWISPLPKLHLPWPGPCEKFRGLFPCANSTFAAVHGSRFNDFPKKTWD